MRWCRRRGRGSSPDRQERNAALHEIPLDESADLPLADYLRARGHDVSAIVRDYPRSLSDRDVLAIAVREQCVLITNDSDFGELIFRLGLPHAGIIFFRLGEESVATKISRLGYVLAHYADHLDQFLVVSQRQVRVRSVQRR